MLQDEVIMLDKTVGNTIFVFVESKKQIKDKKAKKNQQTKVRT